MTWGPTKAGWGQLHPADGGNIPTTILELRVADADVSSLNGGTITQADAPDNTLTIAIPGGATTKDLDDVVLVAWRVKDINGLSMSITATQLVPLMAAYIETTAPGLTSDSGVMFGFMDNATPASANAAAWGPVFAGGGRTVRISSASSGTTTHGTPPANFAMDRMFGTINYSDDAELFQTRAVGHDGDWDTRTGVDAGNPVVSLSGDLYFFVAGYRDAATAGTATVVGKIGHAPTYTLDLDDFG